MKHPHLTVGLPFTVAIILAFYGLANIREFKYNKPIKSQREAEAEWEGAGLKRKSVKTLEEELKLFASAMQVNDDYEMVSTRK